MNAFARVPYRWRYLIVAAIPLLTFGALSVFVTDWLTWIGIALALIGVSLVARAHGKWLRSVTESTLEVRGVDSEVRVDLLDASEEARLAQSINRLADSAVATLEYEQTSRHYHETILDAIDHAILVVDQTGNLISSNSAAQTMFEFDAAAVDDDQIQPFTASVSVVEVSEAVNQCSKSGSTVQRTCTLFNPTRHLHIWATPVESDDGLVSKVLLVIRDITAERRSADSMREFIANASHELRTPITVMQSTIEALQMTGNITGIEAEMLGRMHISARKMGDLVADLLDLTMFETGHAAMHLRPTDIAELAVATCEELRMIADDRGVVLNIDALRSGHLVNADQGKLQRAISNLLTNAIKFSSEGGAVALECAERDGIVELTVRDHGRGIDAEHLPHVFDRFYRTQPDALAEPGFGLGLSIVKNIVELHGGEVNAESTLGVGSEFTISLPSAHNPSADVGEYRRQ